jgi:ribonuclease HI
MKGIASINSAPIQKLHRRANRLANRFDGLTWTWVPRKENKLADKLSRRGLRQLHTMPDAYQDAMRQLNVTPAERGGLISLIDLRVYSPC